MEVATTEVLVLALVEWEVAARQEWLSWYCIVDTPV